MFLFTAALVAAFYYSHGVPNNWSTVRPSWEHVLNIPAYVIGFLGAGIWYSAPELLVSGLSAWQGNPGLAVGNRPGFEYHEYIADPGITVRLRAPLPAQECLQRDFIILIAAHGIVLQY